MDTIDPNDKEAWAAVDKYLEAQPLNYQDLDIDWSTAQYADGQLHVNAIVGLTVPESVYRKDSEIARLAKENERLKAQRDYEKNRADGNYEVVVKLQKQVNELKAERDEVIKLKDQYSARLAVYAKAFGYMQTQIHAAGEPPKGD